MEDIIAGLYANRTNLVEVGNIGDLGQRGGHCYSRPRVGERACNWRHKWKGLF